MVKGPRTRQVSSGRGSGYLAKHPNASRWFFSSKGDLKFLLFEDNFWSSIMGLERRAFNRFICLQGMLMVIQPICSMVLYDLTDIHKVPPQSHKGQIVPRPLSAWICCIPQRN